MILSSNSLSNRVREEIKVRHKWLGIIFNYNKTFPRVLRVLSLTCNMLIMLFIQSLTYTLTNPNEHECTVLTNEEDCLRQKSPYATGESMCSWDAESTGDRCSLVQPDSSITVVLFVAIFSAIVSTPLALFVDWLLMTVLAAPTRPSSPSTTCAAVSPERSVVVAPAPRLRSGSTVLLTPIVPSPAPQQQPVRRSVLGVSRSRLASLFGLRSGAGMSSVESEVRFLAQNDMRQLVSKLTQYRDNLTVEEMREFDGKLMHIIYYL